MNYYAGACGGVPMGAYPPMGYYPPPQQQPQPNPQMNYSNPYAPGITSIPTAKNQQNLYINPASLNMSQAQFVDRMQNYAKQNYFRQQQELAALRQYAPYGLQPPPQNMQAPRREEPKPDYYAWKCKCGLKPRTPGEEGETYKYYINVVFPKEREAFYNTVNAQYGNYNNANGYYQPPYVPNNQFAYGSQYNTPYAIGDAYQRQIDMQKKYIEDQNKLYHMFTRGAMIVRGYSEEEIKEFFESRKPENIMKRQQEEDEKIGILEFELVRGDEVLVSKEQTREIQLRNRNKNWNFAKYAWLSKQPPVQYECVAPANIVQFFKNNIERYGKMSLIEFFDHAWELIEESKRYERIENKRYAQANSYDHNAYRELIKEMEDKDGRYNDGLYQDLIAYRLELERNRPEGFHYDPEKKEISIELPKDFEEFARKDAPKEYNRRKAFYKCVLSKHPDLAHILEGIEFDEEY